jgi:DNA-binding GntR family transcriptional regulator
VARQNIPALSHAPALRQQVYDTLEKLIIDGDLAPGERLGESELAEQLGVSRNPVREALTVLAHVGWVDIRPRVGAEVHTPSPKEMEDFLWVRTTVKREAARLAAQHATDDGVAALRSLIERGRIAVEAGDLRKSSELNSAFHEEVDVLTDNLILQEVLALLKKRLTWYFAPVARARGAESWKELGRLVDALAEHDPEAAASAMRDHCEHTAEVCRSWIGDRAAEIA